MRRILIVAGLVVPVSLAVLLLVADAKRQKADDAWQPSVPKPAYPSRHPRVAIDEAHHNVHTAGGKYRPFARLLEADGYAVERSRSPFTPAALEGLEVLVISNAAGAAKPQLVGINLPIPQKRKRDDPAFTPAEVEAVRLWVERGGSLLLIADHAPMGSAATNLALAFGVRMNKGFVEVPKGSPAHSEGDALLFSRSNGLLGEHPILAGAGAREAIGRVMTFTGQSLDGPPGSAILLRLPADATESVPQGEELHEQKAGSAQGLALSHGQGRVVVLGEAGMLTAQISDGVPFGMNVPGNDNQQLALNILHWLSRRI